MKYALKLARHGSVFLTRVMWIGLMLVIDFFLLLVNEGNSKNLDNMAAPEVPDPLDRGHPNWDFYWGDHE
ncbi:MULTISPECIES: hypothetical protein [Alcaligenes]|uniref:hypothetical protein n=1 Tax=Alcaligenes TaxID=507 RepID=UPI002BDA94E8|nr:hypothetical protein [Alcaligenes phenolicus]HRO19005.1 hypothetical protein [Alcaligenes phenolicus]HRP14842.1 hypothetical protein [Alcaligenes phenolicus]